MARKINRCILPSKRNINIIALFMLLVWFWSPVPVLACPYCNIFNYLAASVRSSTEISVAKVVKVTAEDQAQVQVVRVIRGPFKDGQLLNQKLWNAKAYDGQTLIFCNPTSWPPNFETLPAELEEEVAWLISTAPHMEGPGQNEQEGPGTPPLSQAEKQSVKNIETALRRIQGISNASRSAGLDWIKEQKSFPSAQIRSALLSTRAPSKTAGELTWQPHRQACLLEALMLSPTLENQKFLKDEVSWCLSKLSGSIIWTNFWDINGAPAKYLMALVSLTSSEWKPERWASLDPGKRPESKELRQNLVQQILAVAPTLEDGSLAQIVWALSEWNLVPATDLAKLAKNQNQKDAIALGLYLANRQKVGTFSNNEGLPAMRVALVLAKQAQLKEVIESCLNRISQEKETSTP
jgi:hypothetical protein